MKSIVSKNLCKVCVHAGLSDELCNHPIKRNGNVCCPTLLNNICSYCRKKGHTRKFCNREKIDALNNDKNKTKDKKSQPIKKENNMCMTNIYGVLEDEELVETITTRQVVVSKTKAEKKDETKPEYRTVLLRECNKTVEATTPTPIVVQKRSWADEDSEDETW
jgi:hypothetical protein